jgi:HEAT repeat protein
VPKLPRLVPLEILLFAALGCTACVVSTSHSDPTPGKAVPFLLNVLKDRDAEQRQTAAQALGKIGRAEAVPALLESLGDEDPRVRRQAVWALGAIGEQTDAVRLPLVMRLFDPDEHVRESAALALAKTGGSKAALDLLEQYLQNTDVPSDIRRLTASVLAGMELQSSLSVLAILLKDRDPEVRRWAVAAVAEVGGGSAASMIAGLLKDHDDRVRIETAFRLGKLPGATARSALTAALNDPNDDVRRLAQSALKDSPRSEA